MPSISSRLLPKEDVHLMENLPSPIGPVSPTSTPPINPYLRSPIPNLISPSSDNLKQWGYGGLIPQYRFTPPRPLPVNNNK